MMFWNWTRAEAVACLSLIMGWMRIRVPMMTLPRLSLAVLDVDIRPKSTMTMMTISI